MKSEVYANLYEHELHHWWYRVRRALVRDIITRHINSLDTSHKRLSILDVGCGTGGLMCELKDLGTVTGVDVSNDAVAFCKSRGLTQVSVADISTLPFADKTYDIVVSLDVLEHIEDDARAVRELHRVVKSDGIVIVFVPALMFLWGTTDEVSQHKRRYEKKQLVRCLEDGGFTVTRSTYFNSLLFLPIACMRVLARLRGKDLVDEYRPGDNVLNKLLYIVFSWEIPLLRHISFPIGVSILAVSKQSNDAT